MRTRNNVTSRWLLLLIVTAVSLALAGCATSDEGGTENGQATDDQDEQAEDDAGGAGETLTFVAVDIAYEGAPSEAPAGPLTLELVNEGAIEHNLLIEELGDELVAETNAGETQTGQVELEPGTYTYYCNIPGHREAGMEGTLTVNGG